MAMLPLKQVSWFRWDALLIALALAHGALLLTWASITFIGIGLWWNANTISHNFIHRPFFRSRTLNTAFSCYLSLLLGFPQALWRARHLAHHGAPDRRASRLAALDFGSTLTLWGALLAFAPRFTLTVYLPGYLFGLGLCALQGHYEHARGTISHYGRLYNLLFFNDGYHIEHHVHPGMHWRELRKQDGIEAGSSSYPAVIRWLECVNLCVLERLVLRSPTLQRFVIDRHERALRRLLAELTPFHGLGRVGIVGGGIFPRTAIILRRLLPQSRLALIDLSAENLAVARRFVAGEVEYINKRFDPAEPCDFDLLIIPLSLVGDRRVIYQRLPAKAVLVHDWTWRSRGTSVVVSWLLLKRLNLVTR
jgi:Fatty acid desaturase